MGRRKLRNACIITTCVIAVLLFVILMPLSFQTLGYGEWGIKYHQVSRELDEDTIYEQGRHYVQPGEVYFKFPSTIVKLEFLGTTASEARPKKSNNIHNYGNIDVISSDGLTIVVDVSVQYRLQRTKLVALFEQFGTHYEAIIVKEIRAAIRTGGSNFTAQDFYSQRSTIQGAMLAHAQVNLKQLEVVTDNLALVNVALPPRFGAAISAKETAFNDISQAQTERAGALTQASTSVFNAVASAQQAVIKAQAQANAILAQAQTTADATRIDITTKAAVYKNIKDSFNFTAQELINYISIEQVAQADNLAVSMGAPAATSFDLN